MEDELGIAAILELHLIEEGYRTVSAADGETALQHQRILAPDLILLDARLPKIDGFEVLVRLRQHSSVPVIMLSALGSAVDRLTGLRLGADDYIVKPFHPQEVVARIKAILRRTHNATDVSILRYKNIVMDLDAHVAGIDVADDRRHTLPLTLSEFRILAYMMRRPTFAFSRDDILDACLPDRDALVRTVDTHIANLRRKIEQHGGPAGLFTAVRGVGYRLGLPSG